MELMTHWPMTHIYSGCLPPSSLRWLPRLPTWTDNPTNHLSLDINLDNNLGNNIDKKYRLPTCTGNPTNHPSLCPVPVPPISTLIGRQAGKYTNTNTHTHGHWWCNLLRISQRLVMTTFTSAASSPTWTTLRQGNSKILSCVFMIQVYLNKSGRHSYILSPFRLLFQQKQHLNPHFHFLRQQKQHLCLHFHFLRNNTYTWWEAKEFCENNGGYLVEVGQNQPWFF